LDPLTSEHRRLVTSTACQDSIGFPLNQFVCEVRLWLRRFSESRSISSRKPDSGRQGQKKSSTLIESGEIPSQPVSVELTENRLTGSLPHFPTARTTSAPAISRCPIRQEHSAESIRAFLSVHSVRQERPVASAPAFSCTLQQERPNAIAPASLNTFYGRRDRREGLPRKTQSQPQAGTLAGGHSWWAKSMMARETQSEDKQHCGSTTIHRGKTG
jgi:hypothetical protein